MNTIILNGHSSQSGTQSPFNFNLKRLVEKNKKQLPWGNEPIHTFITESASNKIEEMEQKPFSLIYFGGGEDKLGKFDVIFFLYSDEENPVFSKIANPFYFVKRYRDNKPHGHFIIYIGETIEASKMKGTWHIQNLTDEFEMELN